MSEYLEFVNSNTWNFVWVMIAIATGGLFFSSLLPSVARKRTIVSSEVAKFVSNESAILLDIRDKNSFVQGHIPGSKNAPKAELIKYCQSNNIKPEQAMIIICDRGVQSLPVFKTLGTAGYNNVYILDAGISGWQSANYPLTKK